MARHSFFTNAFIAVINLAILQLCAEDDLYCKPCNQYFNNLHNKREHILGRKHKQTVSGKLSESDAEEEELPGFNAPVFTEEFLKHNESKIVVSYINKYDVVKSLPFLIQGASAYTVQSNAWNLWSN